MKTGQKSKHNCIARPAFLLLICLMLVLVAVGFLLTKGMRTTDPAESSCGVGLSIDPNETEAQPTESKSSMEQDVTIAGIGAVTMSAGQKEVKVDFYNPQENKDLFYLTFELRVIGDSPQDYEVLYTSGFVEPGKHIYEIELSRGLEKGVYGAVIHVQPYRMDREMTRTNNADIVTRLIVG